ncbi:hypothetical protein Btru_026439 [Bulinus truncatus]|nr:hypothetical protein Btru_026439 [Bulinus truncatus]
MMRIFCKARRTLLCFCISVMTLTLSTSRLYTRMARSDVHSVSLSGAAKSTSSYKTPYTSSYSSETSPTTTTTSRRSLTTPTATTAHLAADKDHASVPYKKFMVDLPDDSYYEPYIQIKMDNTDGCQNASSYDAVMTVHSAPTNVAQREAYRWFYGDFNKTSPYKLKVFFFIGQVDSLTLQYQLTNESQQFGDLVQGSFLDSYRNLTYKAIFTFKWLNDHCQGMRLLLRLDDDVFLGLPHLFHAWDVRVGSKTNSIMCDVVSEDRVWREGQWSVEKSDIVEDKYYFDHCLGYFAAMTPDLLHKMDATGRKTRFFWIDDVHAYGFVAKKVGVAFVNVNDRMARGKEKLFESCITSQGDKCNFVTFIVDVEKFYYLYGLIRGNS